MVRVLRGKKFVRAFFVNFASFCKIAGLFAVVRFRPRTPREKWSARDWFGPLVQQIQIRDVGVLANDN